MRRTVNIALVASLAAALLAGAGCVRRVPVSQQAVKTTESTESVPLDKAKALDVQVKMSAGVLSLESTSTSQTAVSGRFVYAPETWKPQVSSSMLGSTRDVRVASPEGTPVNLTPGSDRNEWNLDMAGGVPTKLNVELGAGRGMLDLRGIDLTGLSLQQGAGDVTIDLTGQQTALDVQATLGAGKATIKVPASMRVRVGGSKDGIGGFNAPRFTSEGAYLVNDTYAYASSDKILTINVQRGVGEVDIVEVQ